MIEGMRERLRGIPVFVNAASDVGGDKAGWPSNPVPLIAEWILAAAAAGQPEPHAMHLSTATPDGAPSSRVLLVKDIDHDRLFFATPADSRKGLEIAANPRVAAHFYWPAVGRQVRVTGVASDQGRAASEADFAERGRGSRLSAHLHLPDAPADRGAVLAEFDRLDEGFPDEVPCPAGWTLYAISPTEIEFWEASRDRIHHRVGYHRDSPTAPWQHRLLWP